MLESIQRIINLLPPVGGVTPKNRTTNTVRNAIERNGGGNIVPIIEKFIMVLVESARAIGIRLTVNDLTRFVSLLVQERSKKQLVLPPLYKGVSYNPAGKGWKEWLVLLDFFALMRGVSKRLSLEGSAFLPISILDASFYWLVNLLGEEDIIVTQASPDKAAEEMVSFLMATVGSLKSKKEVYEIALMRNSYMRAIADEFPASSTPPIFSVTDVWRDLGFLEFLSAALTSFCTYQRGKWKVTRAVDYERYMKYSPWVTPLVAAEQAFLGSKCGFQLFLAPVQEAAWNKAVDYLCRLTSTRLYGVLMYERPNAGEIPYRQYPFFADSPEEIEWKLQQAPALLPIIANYVRVFLSGPADKDLAKSIVKNDIRLAAGIIYFFTDKVHKRAIALAEQGFQASPLSNVSWLMRFPPGTC